MFKTNKIAALFSLKNCKTPIYGNMYVSGLPLISEHYDLIIYYHIMWTMNNIDQILIRH